MGIPKIHQNSMIWKSLSILIPKRPFLNGNPTCHGPLPVKLGAWEQHRILRDDGDAMAQAMQTQGLDINVIHLRLLEGVARHHKNWYLKKLRHHMAPENSWRFDIRFDTKHQWLSSISYQNSPEELMGSIRILKIFQPYVINLHLHLQSPWLPALF